MIIDGFGENTMAVPYWSPAIAKEGHMYVLVDSEGNIKGRFDHLWEGEKIANKIEEGRGHGRLEWAGMRSFNEGYGTNGIHFYRMLEDKQMYNIYDRFNREPKTGFQQFDMAVQHCNIVLNKSGRNIEFVEMKPGFWWGTNAPTTPDLIKDVGVAMSGQQFKYLYFEIRRENKYDGKEKL